MNAVVVTLLYNAIMDQQPLVEELADLLCEAENQGEGGELVQRWLREKAEAWAFSTPDTPYQDLFRPLIVWAVNQADHAMLARRLRQFFVDEAGDPDEAEPLSDTINLDDLLIGAEGQEAVSLEEAVQTMPPEDLLHGV